MSLFLIDTAEGASDGQRPAFFLAEEIKRRGHSFQFVVRRGSPLHRKAAEAGLPVMPLKVRSPRKIWSIFRLFLAMKRKECRLVDVHDVRSAALGFAAASLANVPLRILSRRRELSLKGGGIPHRKYIKRLDAVMAVSEEMKKELIDGGIDSRLIRVIPAGMDFSLCATETSGDFLRREFSFGPDDFLAGMVVHPADEKGLKNLIRVNHYLREQAPYVKLIVLGEGRMNFKKIPHLKAIEGENLFFYLGFREHLPQTFHSLDVFVLASDQEGLSAILLGAMACRVPVIVTQSGAPAGMIANGETGLVVPYGRPKSIVQSILKIQEDKNTAHQMARRGHEFVFRKFSVVAMASRVIDLYEELARKKGIRLRRAV